MIRAFAIRGQRVQQRLDLDVGAENEFVCVLSPVCMAECTEHNI